MQFVGRWIRDLRDRGESNLYYVCIALGFGFRVLRGLEVRIEDCELKQERLAEDGDDRWKLGASIGRRHGRRSHGDSYGCLEVMVLIPEASKGSDYHSLRVSGSR